MCGICGVVHAEREHTPDLPLLARMSHPLRWRGPDAEGYFRAPGIGLGHRRLAVLDPAGSPQPMTDASAQITLCYNGEIYNFAELRAELQDLGVSFQTRGDTEVLLQGYRQWGLGVLARLAGMFAFALWDARSETLVLARDRLGVKPLYWTRLADGSLVFASELSGVIAHPDVPRCLDPEQVARFLAFGYVPGEEAILQGIHRLPPAHVLLWQRGRTPRLECYWDLADIWSRASTDTRPIEDIEEDFGALLRQAVRQRLVSDVPVGAFLSGGLDSSTIVALMRQATGQVETFSIGFQEESYSELDWAQEAARALDCRHFAEIVRGDDPQLLLEIAGRQDEPFADTSIIPTYVLSQKARQHVTVALSGDGGDELLAGYVTHLATALHRRVRRMPTLLVRAARWAVDWLPDSRRKVNVVFKAKQFLAGTELETRDAHAWWRTLASPEFIGKLMHPDLHPASLQLFENFRTAHRHARTLTPLDQFLYVDYKTWLVDDILVKADRASMAHGLEVRSPFLDHRLVEFCAGLPSHLKLRRGQGKHLLRRCARDLLPASILRRPKQGFNAPVSHWLAGSWLETVREVLSRKRLEDAGILNHATVSRLLDEHLTQRRDRGYLLFALVMLCLWVERLRAPLR